MTSPNPIHCRVLRQLALSLATVPTRSAHLAAASGLVQVGPWLYVVADDEHQLGVFARDDDAPGTLLRLFEGELPDPAEPRKRVKPDLESLLALPPGRHWPHGALLALPSASRVHRCRAALLRLGASGMPESAARVIDMQGFFAPLRAHVSALNIEGAAIVGGAIVLFQRGNHATATNACLRFDYAAFAAGLACGRVDALAPLRIDVHDLGAIDGSPLAFSDACALMDGRIVFCAVAEDTGDPYLDGRFRGAAIGILDADGMLACLQRIDAPAKVEGIAAQVVDGGIDVLMVSDADDASVAGLLLEARVVDAPWVR